MPTRRGRSRRPEQRSPPGSPCSPSFPTSGRGRTSRAPSSRTSALTRAATGPTTLEPSTESHLGNLRDGLTTVVHHPQGYGLGNAGEVAFREGVPLKAGESNYTELGVETGLLGALLFIAWNVALLV